MAVTLSIPRRATSRRWRIAAVLVTVTWSLAIAALILVWTTEIESIVISGPILFVVAVVALIFAAVARARLFIIAAAVETIVPVAIFLMIYLAELSPGRSYVPVTLIALGYLGGLAPLGLIAWRTRDVTVELWRCTQCGYALIGLSSARCPECGTPFDPAVVQAALTEPATHGFPVDPVTPS